MRIRKLALTDLPCVMRVERASFGAAGYSSTTFLGHVLRDRKHSFVAEDEQGTVVGYGLVRMNLGWLSARRGGITSIAVDPPQRRRGTGRALMARALEYLAEEGVDEADLEVEVNNVAAQSLYEAFGFRRSHLLPSYYGPNRDGMRMVVDVRRANQAMARNAARAKRAADG
jgi:ribosomal-protein-alanine N-acetyltransferase